MTIINRRDFLQRTALAATGVASASALGTMGAYAQGSGPTRGIEGKTAPELTIDYWIDKAGEPSSFTMKEHEGQWVFLKFFQNWCPGCHSSGFPTLKAFSDRFADHPEVAIAGIQTVFEGYASNTVDDVRKLQLRYELPIVMGHDQGTPRPRELPSTMLNYRSGGTPWLVLIDPQRRVIFNDFHVDREILINYVAERVA